MVSRELAYRPSLRSRLRRVGWLRSGVLAVLTLTLLGLVAHAALSGADPHERHRTRVAPSRPTPGVPQRAVTSVYRVFEAPSAQHPLGTDQHGRDLLLRLAHGTRTSLLAGITSTVCFVGLGILFGVMGGYFEGIWRMASAYLFNLVNNFPILLLLLLSVIIVDSVIGSQWLPLRGYFLMALLGVFSSPKLSELIRGHIESLKAAAFVQAAVALGLSPTTIVAKHILWLECRPFIVVQAAYMMGQAILVETTLTYLQFGLEHPRISWGLMIREMASALFSGELAILLVVGAMALAVFYFQYLAGALNAVLRPERSR